MNYRAYRSASIAPEALLLGVAPYALALGVGFLLVLFADRLAPRLLPEPAAGHTAGAAPALVRTSGPELQAIAFSVLGVLLVTWSARSLVLTAWAFYALHQRDVSALEQGGWGRYATEAAVEAGLGVWLFFGAKRLATFWQRLRGQGSPAAGAMPAIERPR